MPGSTTLLTVQLTSHCASVSSSVKSRFYLHSFGLDLAMDIDFKKSLFPASGKIPEVGSPGFMR